MADLTLILDFVIIFLLITAIMYGFVLNKRINLIRNSGRELSQLFRSFDDTILKAQNSVEDLKRISSVISDGLQKKIDKAALLIDDIAFVHEKATITADKMSEMLAVLKKMESKVGPIARNRDVVATPLVMTPPPDPKRNTVAEKPGKFFQKKRALEDILDDMSHNKGPNANNNSRNAADAAEKAKNTDKRQFSIASALKALGYGD